jgi:hypothetical protein
MATRHESVALPATKPTCVAELEMIVHASGKHRQKAHIPVRLGDNAEPLCVDANAYNGCADWTAAPTVNYPGPDQWWDLCERCLAAYDQEVRDE